MLFARYGDNVRVLHERQSRCTLSARPPDRKAAQTINALADLLAPLPSGLRQSLTLDNGTEFADHYKLAEILNLPTFFCDPHSLWQKGGVENARSEEHTSELQSLMRISYAVFCLKKKKTK